MRFPAERCFFSAELERVKLAPLRFFCCTTVGDMLSTSVDCCRPARENIFRKRPPVLVAGLSFSPLVCRGGRPGTSGGPSERKSIKSRVLDDIPFGTAALGVIGGGPNEISSSMPITSSKSSDSRLRAGPRWPVRLRLGMPFDMSSGSTVRRWVLLDEL